MAKLYFIRRTTSEVNIYGGRVYADIDGKQVGEVGLIDLIVEVTPGIHHIKMYKTHSYDSLIGFAEVDIDITEGKDITLKYSAPMIVSQPGHIVVSDFISMRDIEEQTQQKEQRLRQEKAREDNVVKEQKSRQNRYAWIWVVAAVLCVLSWLIWQIVIWL